jgi:phosphohistidine phosphatase
MDRLKSRAIFRGEIMKILIVRHGIAEESARGGDRARALTDEGKKKMKEAAEGFARLDLEIDTIYSSPLVRAIQTAEILAKAIDYKETIENMEELSPGYSPKDVMQRLQSLKKVETIALAGHEPNCSELASHLLGDAEVEFKKGAICLLETESLQTGSGNLIWHLSPQILRMIAR